MSEADPALVNCTFSPSTNSSWSDGMDTDEYNRIVEVTETTILPAFVGFLCTTGLVGNILVLVTVLRYGFSLLTLKQRLIIHVACD